MNQTNEFKVDHDRLKELSIKIRDSKDSYLRRSHYLDQFTMLFKIHAQEEDQVFYMNFERTYPEEIVLRLIREHHDIDHLLEEIHQVSDLLTWNKKVVKMLVLVESHLAEEEKLMENIDSAPLRRIDNFENYYDNMLW